MKIITGRMKNAECKNKKDKRKLFLNSSFIILPSAFTLIEILISLTLLTIVLGAVYSSFFSVHSVLERFDNVSLKYHEARTALDIMRREIESALQKNSQPHKDAEDKTAFVIRDRDIAGKSTSELDITAFSFKGSGLDTISYYVEEKDGKLNLLRKESPAGIQSKGYIMESIEGIEGFTVETFFNNQWVRTWNTANSGKLRGMVRVSIEFDDNGNKVKLVEYARPRVGTTL
jgi:prepilin-type N-terminal cleavage/methylation domain-containing protein